mgnify:CR=1 FL=1
MEFGEERLVGLGLDSLRFAAQPTAACEVAQDAPVEERKNLHHVAIGERLGGMEERSRADGRRAEVSWRLRASRPRLQLSLAYFPKAHKLSSVRR